MTIGEPSAWNKEAASLLKQFLETPTGRLFLAHLGFSRPALSGSKDINEVALTAKYASGYELAINRIFSLTEAEAPEPSAPTENPNFPNLDDDSQWPGETKTT